MRFVSCGAPLCLVSLLVLEAGCGRSVDPATAPASAIAPAQAASQRPEPMQPAPAPNLVSRGGLQFYPNYSEGAAHAREQRKPMLLFFTARWCKFCHEMEREAFVNTDVVGLASEFICVMVDADQEAEVCADFGVRGFPTVQFVSYDGVQLNRLVGRSGAIELADQMQSALRAASQRIASQGKPLYR